MAGRRLLDAAAIFKGSRGVVSKYITLRGHQLDTFSKTSSVAKVIKYQTERITLTLRAASALNERFNSPSPQYSAQAYGSGSPSSEAPSAGKDGVGEENSKSRPKNGLEQDHFYTRSDETTTAQLVPEENLGVKQETAKRNPLPDGSIPPEDSDSNKSEQDRSTFSDFQHAALAKESVVTLQTGAELIPKSCGNSTIPKPTSPTKPLVPEKARKLQRLAESQSPSQSAEPPASGDSSPNNETAALGVEQGKDVFNTASSNSGPVLSLLPHVKAPEVTENMQGTNKHLADEPTNPDVYYTSGYNRPDIVLPQAQAVPEQDSPPEDAFSEIFQSPRVARLLSGKQRQAGIPEGLYLQGPQQIVANQSKSPNDSDQETYSTRQAPAPNISTTPKIPATEDTTADHGKGEVDSLAAVIAKDNKHDAQEESHVCCAEASQQVLILID